MLRFASREHGTRVRWCPVRWSTPFVNSPKAPSRQVPTRRSLLGCVDLHFLGDQKRQLHRLLVI